MYAARSGRSIACRRCIVQRTQLRWLSIDHRAGFVLSLIDGSSTLEMILDVCGMPRLDAMRILHELVQQKVVALKRLTVDAAQRMARARRAHAGPVTAETGKRKPR